MNTFQYDLDLIEQAMNTYVCNIDPSVVWGANYAAQAMSDVQDDACKQQLLAANIELENMGLISNYDDVCGMRANYTYELADLIDTYEIMFNVATDVQRDIDEGNECNSLRVALADRLRKQHNINVIDDGRLIEDYYIKLIR